MTAPTEAYPLTWPDGRVRTPAHYRETARFETSFARARDNLKREVELLVGRHRDPKLIISTNIPLRKDGLPLANYPRVTDMGVAVYFHYNGQDVSFACDRWGRIEHNMQAIAKTIEALRGIARWGTGDMLKAAFTGFKALPAPAQAPSAWHIVLGVDAHTSTEKVIEWYRQLRSDAHRSNNTERFMAVNAAYEQFRAERGLA